MVLEYVTVLNTKIYTPGIFGLLALIIGSYVMWREARKEGFDEEQVFDMIILVLMCSIFIGRMVFALNRTDDFLQVLAHTFKIWIPGHDLIGFLAGALIVTYLWSRGKRWSLYRVIDIVAMGGSLALPVVLVSYSLVTGVFEYVIAAGFVVLLHVVLVILRSRGFVFGGLFGVSLVGVSLILSPVVFRDAKNLIFLMILFTLGLLVLFRRLRSNKVALVPGISKDFLKNIKDFLTKKDKQLAEEEVLLKKESASSIPDRDVMNNENADEAMEDESITRMDLLGKSVADMRLQIRKALAKINIGTYGICDICHKPIDPARLKAFPQATTCVECSEKG